MPYSQNGWAALTTGSSPLLVALAWVTGKVRAGAVHVIFDYLARRFDAEVERIDKASSWGYAYRAVRAAFDLSNHASGTAVDFNATRHPLGKVGTFSAAQVAAIRRILADLEGVIRWGGNYAGRKDEMHFEVVGSAADVVRVAARITAGLVGRTVAKTTAPSIPELDELPDPITPLPPEETHMRVISAPGRGQALVGPGYYGWLATSEHVDAATTLTGKPPLEGNDRQFDLWHASCVQGQGIDGELAAATVTGDAAAIAASLAILPAEIAEKVLDLLGHRLLTNGA